VEEQLGASRNVSEAIAVVEDFLRSNFSPSRPDKLVHEAVRLLMESCGQIKMHDLADHLCISQDAFEKRFRKVAGASPKHFARIIRLRAIINPRQNTVPITSLALQAGYYDSAHFNKDFKSFTGQSPSEFFKKPVFW
jgi:transcriptional regulator GlxA family with amidase domain